MEAKRKELMRLNSAYKNILSNAKVTLLEGRGKVTGPHTVEVRRESYSGTGPWRQEKSRGGGTDCSMWRCPCRSLAQQYRARRSSKQWSSRFDVYTGLMLLLGFDVTRLGSSEPLWPCPWLVCPTPTALPPALP